LRKFEPHNKNFAKMNKVKFSLKRSGAFYRKMQVVAHRDALGLFKFNPIFDGYDVNHKLCVTKVQIFLFWFILEIDLPLVDQGSNQKYQIYHPKDMRKSYS